MRVREGPPTLEGLLIVCAPILKQSIYVALFSVSKFFPLNDLITPNKFVIEIIFLLLTYKSPSHEITNILPLSLPHPIGICYTQTLTHTSDLHQAHLVSSVSLAEPPRETVTVLRVKATCQGDPEKVKGQVGEWTSIPKCEFLTGETNICSPSAWWYLLHFLPLPH